MSGKGNKAPSTKIVKPKTKAGIRALERRAPKIVEEPRRSLVLYGNKTSQIIKDVLIDIHKLKGNDSLKYSRKNDDIHPFEVGGEVQLEIHTNRSNCSLFALGSHSKKRPHNLVLGRMFDFRLYDAIEFGVTNFKPIREYPGSIVAQLGNKPSFIFVGEAFESNPVLKQTRSLLLDYFRGRQIEHLNLKGLDRVIFVTHAPLAAVAGASADGGVHARGVQQQQQPKLFFRQYSVKFKKSGTKVPRVELTEMGPHMDLDIRRRKAPPVDLEKDAMTQPKVAPKKQKNVAGDVLDGKVGRIYMPKQNVETMALNKMKGLKRERRESKAAAAAEGNAGGDGEDGRRSKRTRKGAAADE
ncbi:hypothetical protein Ndes2437B_g08502 [Nannochloris sp. 'desiccata']